MEKEFKKIIERVRQVKLSPEEKERMRESLLLFIERNPVREEVPTRPQLQKRSFLNQLRLRPMPVFAVIAVITLMVGGGTSLAAESALPGEALYPVKVSVNEEVRGAFTFSDEAKARLAANLIERRLQEAAELAAEGKLTAESQAEIESRFNAHMERFEARANRLAAKGKVNAVAELNSNLEVSLRAHSQIIAGAGSKAEGERKVDVQVGAVQPLLTAIQVRLGAVQKTRADAEARVSTEAKADVEAAAEGKLKAATNKIAEVRGAIERTRGSLSASTTAEAEARLRLAEEAIVQGKIQLEADAFAEAFMSFDRAHRLAQETQLLVNAAHKFKIELIKENGKYGRCSAPMPAMPNWICPDGSTAGPACEDGRWMIKQCPSSDGTSTEVESKTETKGEGRFWLNFGF